MFFAFFNAERKKNLYILGNKFYSYGKTKANFIGRFIKHYVVDEAEYKKKKKDALIGRAKATEEAEIKRQMETALFERLEECGIELSVRDKAAILNVPVRTYYYKIKIYQEGKEFGG